VTTLLVASSGGHLKQLHSLRPRLDGIDDGATWATFDCAQARSLLAEEDVVYVHAQPPRDYLACSRNMADAIRILRRGRFTDVVSTGAGVALAFLPAAAALGARCHYIESATRADGPSLTGSLLRRVPGIRLYTQYRRWCDRSWQYRGSVFDPFEAEAGAPRPIARAVVTLGTQEGYPFTRLARQLVGVLPDGVETLWQTGSTPTDGLPIAASHSVPAATLEAAMADADVVIAHAGTGSALTAMEAGRCPVLVPRSARHGEHVDDHQAQIAAELDARCLAMACAPEDLTLEVLERAAARRVVVAAAADRFRLF